MKIKNMQAAAALLLVLGCGGGSDGFLEDGVLPPGGIGGIGIPGGFAGWFGPVKAESLPDVRWHNPGGEFMIVLEDRPNFLPVLSGTVKMAGEGIEDAGPMPLAEGAVLVDRVLVFAVDLGPRGTVKFTGVVDRSGSEITDGTYEIMDGQFVGQAGTWWATRCEFEAHHSQQDVDLLPDPSHQEIHRDVHEPCGHNRHPVQEVGRDPVDGAVELTGRSGVQGPAAHEYAPDP